MRGVRVALTNPTQAAGAAAASPPEVATTGARKGATQIVTQGVSEHRPRQ
jgi:hypothetical protein